MNSIDIIIAIISGFTGALIFNFVIPERWKP